MRLRSRPNRLHVREEVPIPLNDAGQIVGLSNSHAVMWAALGGGIVWSDANSGSQANAISTHGVSCGQDLTNAVTWSPAGVETVLTNPMPGTNANATMINAAGETAGFAGNDAVLWSSAGGDTVLRPPIGSGSQSARLLDINASG
jgi:hypothetical protein